VIQYLYLVQPFSLHNFYLTRHDKAPQITRVDVVFQQEEQQSEFKLKLHAKILDKDNSKVKGTDGRV
jgi:hypothetical protein